MTIFQGAGSEVQTTLQEKADLLPSHLGGHLDKTHNDRGALRYLIEELDIKSFLDIGCGPGGMIKLANWRGLKAVGIDGDWLVEKERDVTILIHDFNDGPPKLDETFDLAWSVEFLEHVDEQYQDNYMQAFVRCKYAVVTHATMVGKGHHHVNCKPAEYWIKVFDKYGFDYDDALTQKVRAASSMQKPFMQKTGLFFERRKSSE